MKLLGLVPLTIVLAALTGCAAPPTPPNGSGSAPSAPVAAAETRPGLAECAGIIDALNADDSDPTQYTSLAPREFAAPEVGAQLLSTACIIRPDNTDEPFTWAILPADASLAQSIGETLLSAGFYSPGPGLYYDDETRRGVKVWAFEDGSGLDAYMVSTSAFAVIDQPVVFVGTFPLV